jgi:hypothetical protein
VTDLLEELQKKHIDTLGDVKLTEEQEAKEWTQPLLRVREFTKWCKTRWDGAFKVLVLISLCLFPGGLMFFFSPIAVHFYSAGAETRSIGLHKEGTGRSIVVGKGRTKEAGNCHRSYHSPELVGLQNDR